MGANLHFHHGGMFVQKERFTYEGGGCVTKSDYDMDKVSYFELKGYAEELGYTSHVDYYYCLPGEDLHCGLKPLRNDEDACQMINIFAKELNIHVYCNHVVDETQISSHTFPELLRLISLPLNEHICSPLEEVEYDFNDPRPESPIPWNELIGRDLITDSSDDDIEYVPNEAELFNDEPLTSRNGRNRRSTGASVDHVNEVDERIIDDDTDVEDVETSDDEWVQFTENRNKFIQKRDKISDIMVHEQPGAKVVHLDKDIQYEKNSEYETTDEELESDDEDDDLGNRILKRQKRPPSGDDIADFKKFKWVVGTTFSTAEKFREAVRRFALNQGYDIRYTVSDIKRKKFKVVCRKNCKFHVYTSWDRKKALYIVRSVGNGHKCIRNMSKNTQLTSTWMAKYYLHKFKETPNWPGKQVMLKVKREFGICISLWVAFKVKQRAGKLLHGSMREHFSKVGRYIEELRRSNPSSTFILETNPNITRQIPIFQRLFVCFDGLRNGLIHGCRRVLCIDAGFLKTFLGGTLLSAIGVDGNNQMFPLAWAVAEGENNDSWEWFLTRVRGCIGSTDGNGWTIISDQHKAILHGVGTVLPASEHRNCARHIYANWKKLHKGEELKILFWIAARAYSEADYELALAELKKASLKGAEDFVAQKPKSFCRAFIKRESKCDYVVNNMAETFNAYAVEARAKHLIFCLEDIRVSLMQRIVIKRAQMEKSEDNICFRVRVKLETERENSRFWSPIPSDNNVFEVTNNSDKVIVDLNTNTCSCRRWDCTGIPCCHVISCLSWLGKDVEDFVHPYFKREMFMKAYASAISPCVGEKYWPTKNLPLDPPDVKVGPGRPKKKRKRDPHEDPNRPGKLTRHGREMMCSHCKKIGHNIRTCPDKNNVATTTTTTTRDGRGRRSTATPTPTAGRGRGRGGRASASRGRGGRERHNRGLEGWFTAGRGVNIHAQQSSLNMENPEMVTQGSVASN